MERIKVKSSNISSIGWSPETETLEVAFLSKKDGEPERVYQYPGVSFERYKTFLNSASPGSHFANHIKNQFEGHRIDTPKKEKKDAQDSQEERKED